MRRNMVIRNIVVEDKVEEEDNKYIFLIDKIFKYKLKIENA